MCQIDINGQKFQLLSIPKAKNTTIYFLHKAFISRKGTKLFFSYLLSCLIFKHCLQGYIVTDFLQCLFSVSLPSNLLFGRARTGTK